MRRRIHLPLVHRMPLSADPALRTPRRMIRRRPHPVLPAHRTDKPDPGARGSPGRGEGLRWVRAGGQSLVVVGDEAGPGVGVLDAQDLGAGVAGQSHRGVQEPGAQASGFNAVACVLLAGLGAAGWALGWAWGPWLVVPGGRRVVRVMGLRWCTRSSRWGRLVGDRGVSSVEYVAVLLAVAMVLSLVGVGVVGASPQVGRAVAQGVCRVGGGEDCEGARPDAPEGAEGGEGEEVVPATLAESVESGRSLVGIDARTVAGLGTSLEGASWEELLASGVDVSGLSWQELTDLGVLVDGAGWEEVMASGVDVSGVSWR